jgi:hypothetical protein
MSPETAKTVLLVIWVICSVGTFGWARLSPMGSRPSVGYHLVVSVIVGGGITMVLLAAYSLLLLAVVRIF